LTKRDRHLFLKTGEEALKLGKVPQNNIKDLEEYMNSSRYTRQNIL
jgi:hypothetical protein